MKVVGLITEYNPFHNGHKYHIDEAKRISGADYVVIVMSGSFVQRGAPALMDKYQRTEMALLLGADLVLELPTCYATSSAEYFALGAVSLLHKLGIVDEICFGSECGDVTILTELAHILLDEPKEFKDVLSIKIKEGNTYPVARMEAIKTLYPTYYDTILTHPNNILGIEYIKALITLKSNMKALTITRKTASYHSKDLSLGEGQKISSATAIRRALFDNKELKSVEQHLPLEVYQIMKEQYLKSFPVMEDDFSLLLQYKLQYETIDSLASYVDITPDLANRIYKLPIYNRSISDYSMEIKTKQWTLTRINRCLIHILLNHKKERFHQYNSDKDNNSDNDSDIINSDNSSTNTNPNSYTQYARILGVKKESSHLIRQIQKHEMIPVITKVADAKNQLNETGYQMLMDDIHSTHLYNQMVYSKYGTSLKNEYQRGIILI